MKKDYTIGLDIGTNSIGWAVVDDELNLFRKRMLVYGNTSQKKIKKNFWGSTLFDKGETAESTRLSRNTRRRLSRRRYRIVKLQEIFADEINKIDPAFFHRLNESFLVPEDKNNNRHPIFGTIEDEIDYHRNYPTIYHLRKDLIDNKDKKDIRLVYLALAHIIKFRGHFLIEGELNVENSSIIGTLTDFIDAFHVTFEPENSHELTVEEFKEIEMITKDKISRSTKFDQIMPFFKGEKKTGLLAQFLKIIVGNKANFKGTFDLEEELKLSFAEENFEEDLEELLALTNEEYRDVFIKAKSVYDAIELSDIITGTDEKTHAKLSTQMVKHYDQHAIDLKAYKTYIRKNLPDEYKETFNDSTKNGYAGYIDGKTSQENFYKYVENQVKKAENSGKAFKNNDEWTFKKAIQSENFMRKQRSLYNGVIPHQIHLQELQRIVLNQGKHYSFLADSAKKLEQLVSFRIPYYVGPLVKNNEQSEFSWIVKNSDESITPFNFDQVVNRDESAKQFINKLTNYCTYLPDEKVLPKRSLLYQKYTIFNELTKIKYTNDQGLLLNFSSEEKLEIFDELFKKHVRVTKKQLVKFLENHYHLDAPLVYGIEDAFNANYSTYVDLNKISGMESLLESDEHTEILEEIIRILTVFEDREMRRRQLEQIDILNESQVKALSRKHYTGWGRLSAELIDGISDSTSHKTILDYLIEDDDSPNNRNRNLMELINDESLSFKSIIAEKQDIDESDNLEKIIDDIPGSPAIKKSINQTINIVDEIVKIMGYKPKNIVIEMARENQTTDQGKRLSQTRLKKIEAGIKDLDSDLLKKHPIKDNYSLNKNRMFLYYLQNGKDMYTGECLDINFLSKYDIDHIIPQSFITDNSIDNIVLVKSTLNRAKSNDVPSREIVNRQKSFWENLLKAGLISQRKFNNLTKAERGGLTADDKARFINRQLVETRQITKHVANILDTRINTDRNEDGKILRDTNVVLLKSALTSQFRKEFNLHKVREVNDYHHGHDAYLNAVIAIKLLLIYPQLAPDFVYGQFKKYKRAEANRATANKLRMSNLMKSFEKEYIINENGEILWNAKRDLGTIRKTLNFKHMNFVKKVEQSSGMLFKQNPKKKSNSDKLIPIKEGLDTSKYGGYPEVKTAYYVAFIYLEKGKEKERFLGIPIKDIDIYESNPVHYLKEKGFEEANVKHTFKNYTLFEFSDGTRRLISGAGSFKSDSRGEMQKANQLFLSTNYMNFLYHLKRYDEVAYPESYEFINNNTECFDEILDIILDFSKQHDLLGNYEEKIIKAYKHYWRENNQVTEEFADSFINLFDLTAYGAPSEVKFLDIKLDRRRHNTLSKLWDANAIFQSITGLHETRINMRDL